MKVFGSWAAELADRWDDDDLSRVRSVVDDVLDRLRSFVTHTDIEVQERVSPVLPTPCRSSFFLCVLAAGFTPVFQAAELLQLFTFIHADLAGYKPQGRQPASSTAATMPDFSFGDDGGFGGPSFAFTSPAAEPRFPKSLHLIKPLFAAHELNAVAQSAQASVPVPAGLDLDAWIVPGQDEPATPPAGAEPDDDTKGKKVRKGKKKDTGKTARKGKARARAEDGDEDYLGMEGVLAASAVHTETPEERAERERVSALPCVRYGFASLFASLYRPHSCPP